MSEEETNRRDAKGETAKSNEWVSGPGGPTFTEGGMMPGGSEMENWNQPRKDQAGSEPSPEEQGENLRERLEER